MNYRKFTLMAYGWALAIGALVAVINLAVDPYGLFHGHRGRTCTIYYNERTSKYLLASRYIPDHFDGLLLGTSISLNWNTARLHGAAIYNASLDGGNISEAKLIADRVLLRRPPRLLLMVIYPYMTSSFGRVYPDTMLEGEYWGALGSHQLVLNYTGALAVRLGLRRPTSNAFGWKAEDLPMRSTNAPVDPEEERLKFKVDERAVGEYADLLKTVRQAKVKIVGVIPPVDPVFWAFERNQFEAYQRRILPLFHAGEPIIDFNGPEYAALRAAPAAFPDGIHISPGRADELVALLDARLRALGME